jgi:predicted MFS family arabinose efflux permease
MPPGDPHRGTVWRFVVMIGVVSLLSDTTYEGARSLTGPYLAFLGAGAAAVGVVAGLGELVGYGFRLVSGHIADRTRAYWPVTILGYCLNLLAVPALALANSWEVAAALIILERLGKAVRVPPRDAMLSHAASETSRGWAFGLHEAMDQLGAFLGPLVVSGVMFLEGGYRTAFGILLIPALMSLAALFFARSQYPRPQELEISVRKLGREGIQKGFWVYLVASAAIAAGYVDFPLIAYHLKRTAILADKWIPLIYAAAMATDGLSAMALGKLYDRHGIKVLAGVCLLTSLFPPLVFLGREELMVLGMIIWGVGIGAQESILRAAIPQMVPPERRATAYGVFHTAFGVSWFAGSAAMGSLYDLSLAGVIGLSTALQVGAACILVGMRSFR